MKLLSIKAVVCNKFLNMKKLLLSLLVICFFAAPQVTKAAEIPEKINELVNQYIELGTFSGTVLVAKEGKIIYEKAYGMEDVESGKPITMNTRFNIGSMGKTFTAIAIMQFVEEGKLKLDDKLSEILPEYKFANADKITLGQILSHTAGLSNYMNHPDYNKKKNEYTRIDQFMTLAVDVPAAGVPGEKLIYSNTGFLVLGKIIEKLSGKEYFEYIKEKIWKPAGMENTTTFAVNTRAENKAAGYELLPTGEKIYQGLNDLPALSDGGTFASAYDLFKYADAIQKNVYLKEETKKLMITKRGDFGSAGYGYGLIIYTDKGENVFGHGGDCPGFSSDLDIFGDKGYTVIVLSNYQGLSRGLNVRLMDVVNGNEYPKPKKPVLFVLYDALQEKGAKYLSENLNSVLQEKGFSKLESDEYLNSLGYILMQKGNLDEAIEVFTINTKLFPAIANVWDSLGESYMNKGDKDNAVKNYRKVLELDAQNANAKAMISKLEK